MPKFLLRRFADERGNLRRFDISGDVVRAVRVNAKSATVVEDFYVIDSLTTRYDIEERETISRLEDGAAKVLNRLWAANDLANVWPLSEGDRNALCAFLASLVLRTPRFRKHTKEVAEQWLKSENRDVHPIDLIRNGVVTGEPDVLAALQRRYGLWLADEDPPPNFHAQMFRENFHLLGQHLWGQRWILMRADHPFFSISDNPVALLSNIAGDREPSFHTVDFRASRASFAALGRDLLLFTDWHPPELLGQLRANGDSVIPFDPGRARYALSMLIANSDRYIFSHPQDDVIEDIFAGAGLSPRNRADGME